MVLSFSVLNRPQLQKTYRASHSRAVQEKKKRKKEKNITRKLPTHARKGHPQKTHSDVVSALLSGSVVCVVIR